jgi:hypothetical protein
MALLFFFSCLILCTPLARQYECQRRIHLTIIANKEFQVMNGALK